MADELRFDEIGYWSEVKLDIVRKYASAYSTILSKKDFIRGHVYIDAFAGAGTHLSKSTGLEVAGSPRIALDTTPPFTELHFIDLNGSRVKELQRLAGSDPRVKVHSGDCNRILMDDVLPRCRFQDYKRALCLLDPYSLNIDWRVLQTAGEMESVEVFYNFMIMDANMNVFIRNPSKISPDGAARMDAVWGDHSWREIGYRTRTDLFGDVEEKVTNEEIAEAFRVRLQKKAGFSFVPDPMPMRNSKGAVVYYLYFASPDKTGAKIVQEIFDRYRNQGVV